MQASAIRAQVLAKMAAAGVLLAEDMQLLTQSRNSLIFRLTMLCRRLRFQTTE
jgi:hypothetical protein